MSDFLSIGHFFTFFRVFIGKKVLKMLEFVIFFGDFRYFAVFLAQRGDKKPVVGIS